MPETLPSVPSSTFLETLGYMLWMMIEPFGAALNAYEPWTVAIIALLLGLIPLSRRLTPFKVVAAAVLAFGAYVFGPLSVGLSPVGLDAFATETYIQLGLLMLEAAVVIIAVHMIVDAAKGLGRAPKTSRPAKAVLVAFRQAEFADKASLNFTHRVTSPLSRALSQTLSIPKP